MSDTIECKPIWCYLNPPIQELIEEIDLCIKLLGYDEEALERMEDENKNN